MDFTLHHGDCLELMKAIPPGSVDMILTDPPYGTTACKWDNVIHFEPMWEQIWRVLKPNGACLLFGSEPFSSALRMSQIKRFKHDWYWKKKAGTGFLNAKKYPLMIVETISVFCLKTPVYHPQFSKGKPYNITAGSKTDNYGQYNSVTTINEGFRYPLNFIEFAKDYAKQHPTQKPVALLEYLIKTYTLEGETVLDFTMGSGSTGVACVNTGRNFIGIEMDDKYFEIAKQRIETTPKTLLP
jgi:DNA modification methylase